FVWVLKGIGGGQFSTPLRFNAGIQPYGVVAGDFNADGVIDLAVADNGESHMLVLIGVNDGSGHWNGQFAPLAYALPNPAVTIPAGDRAPAGITDLIATEGNVHTVAIFLGIGNGGQPDGTFRQAVHVPAGDVPYEVVTADFNGDGNLDLAVASVGAGGVQI